MSNTGDSIAVGMRAEEGVIFDSVDATGSSSVSRIETSHVSPSKEIVPHVAQANQLDPVIVKQFVCTATFNWKSSQSAGTLLWSVPIMPLTANMWLKYLCGMYNTWRGGFDYKIKVAGTGFHSGAILLVRLPPNYKPTDIKSTAGATAFPYVVIDPKCLEAISHGMMDQANIMYHWMSKDVSTVDTQLIGGYIAVYVMLALGSNTDAATNINVQIFSKPSPDFRFGQLVPPPDIHTPSVFKPLVPLESSTPVFLPPSECGISIDPVNVDSRPNCFIMRDLKGVEHNEFTVYHDYPEYKTTQCRIDRMYLSNNSVKLSQMDGDLKIGNYLPVAYLNPTVIRYVGTNFSTTNEKLTYKFDSDLPVKTDAYMRVFTPSNMNSEMTQTSVTNFVSPTRLTTMKKVPLYPGETLMFYKNQYNTVLGKGFGSINCVQSVNDSNEFTNFPLDTINSLKVAVYVPPARYGFQPPAGALVRLDGSWLWTFFRLAFNGACMALAISTGNVLAAGKIIFDTVDIIVGDEYYATSYQNECELFLPLLCLPFERWRTIQDVERYVLWHNAYDFSCSWDRFLYATEFGYIFPYSYLLFFFHLFDIKEPYASVAHKQLISICLQNNGIDEYLLKDIVRKFPSTPLLKIPIFESVVDSSINLVINTKKSVLPKVKSEVLHKKVDLQQIAESQGEIT